MTALLTVSHDWLTHLGQKQESCRVLFNFQKAFDTVPHGRLMERLKELYLHPPILSSYLTKSVHSDGATSNSM